MNAKLEAIAYYLPKKVETNSDLSHENPEWNMQSIQDKSGVVSRHIAGKNETALTLALEACTQLRSSHPDLFSKIDGIIFCTQSPDYIMPGNAHLVHEHFGMRDEVLAFDFNLACSGYIYGLAFAESLIQSEMASTILLVTGDTYSKFINLKDRSARVLFGDGAAATLLSGSAGPKQFSKFQLWSHGKGSKKFYIPSGGCKFPKSGETAREEKDSHGNIRSSENIYMDGMAVWSFINSAVPKQISALLEKTGTSLNEIDHFVFHQASKMTLDSLIKKLQIPIEKVALNLENVGNTVSSSIPIVLKDALESGRIKKGQKVLIAGFGVGLSYGATIWENR